MQKAPNTPEALDRAISLLMANSPYVKRQKEILSKLLAEEDCQNPMELADYQNSIQQISLDSNPQSFAKALRHYRQRHLLRLLLREQALLSNGQETMRSWSDCADTLILYALEYCARTLAPRFGKACDEFGKSSELYTLAMGKLGGRELNFSSDIDLIFAYRAAGFTNGPEVISNQEFYQKLVQNFLPLMQNISPEGFIFRVDLRLRPYGDSGPLITSLSALETYYQEQGRDWERYAMVKARIIKPACEEYPWFNELIKPFVYRRYVDYSVIESLRIMKAMIERELQLNPNLDDIKRGRGGIREVEFIIQSFQLIRGGRLPDLQEQNAIKALHVLADEGLLRQTQALEQAYLFLRQLENVLQSYNDQQTHALPNDPTIQASIAALMHFSDWQSLQERLSQYRRIISRAFQAVLAHKDLYADEDRMQANEWMKLWQGHIESNLAVSLLKAYGFSEAARCYQLIQEFRHSARCRRLSQTARLRLDRLMVLLLKNLAQTRNTELLLLGMLLLLESIVGRSAYLALLTENPAVLEEILQWFQSSSYISNLLVNQPFLLEVFLDAAFLEKPLSISQLTKELESLQTGVDDEELFNENLRQYKLKQSLLIARAELLGSCTALEAAAGLSDLAEVLIQAVIALSFRQLAERYPEIVTLKERFTVIAYGKLGSREMNYDSDVDLVFLHQASPNEEALLLRLTQKIMHNLMLRGQAGLLYLVDTRLRPSGSAGLLLSPLEAFLEYQSKEAWIWEHQAILRARVLMAEKKSAQQFKTLKEQILAKPRETKLLREEVLNMREKMKQQSLKESLKQEAGGLLDLEFLIQFLLLSTANPKAASLSNSADQIQFLIQAKTLSLQEGQALIEAYQHIHQALHKALLLNQIDTDLDQDKQQVTLLCEKFYSVH